MIRNISYKFWGDSEGNLYEAIFDETDLSVRRLEELREQLLKLQNQMVWDLFCGLFDSYVCVCCNPAKTRGKVGMSRKSVFMKNIN